MVHHPLKRFLHRHNQLFTLVGALIVFLTFIVNDVLRERLKEMASSIATTQSFFLIRRDIRVLHEQTESIWKLVGQTLECTPRHVEAAKQREIDEEFGRQKHKPADLASHAPATSNVRLYGQLLSTNREYWNALVETTNNTLDRLTQLIRGIPEDPAINSELQSLKSEGKTLSKDRDAAYTRSTRKWIESGAVGRLDESLSEPGDVDAIIELEQSVGQYQRGGVDWNRKVVVFSGQVLKRAEETRDRAEHRYKIYTRASYFLYTLGWSLALVGRLYGVEVPV